MTDTPRPAPEIKLHAEDWDLAKLALTASYFTAHLRCGRNTWTARDLPTYEAAVEAGAALEAEHATYGRKAIIYAVTPKTITICMSPEVVHCVAVLRAGEV